MGLACVCVAARARAGAALSIGPAVLPRPRTRQHASRSRPGPVTVDYHVGQCSGGVHVLGRDRHGGGLAGVLYPRASPPAPPPPPPRYPARARARLPRLRRPAKEVLPKRYHKLFTNNYSRVFISLGTSRGQFKNN